MPGDVQPRKRKEKKKKKEDGSEETQHQSHQHLAQPAGGDDVNIHVEKEVVTGGGVCAKIVFFFLLAALAVLIGLLITEQKELTDLDAADTDSRFSKLFAGWTDNSPHDDDDDHLIEESEFQTNDSTEDSNEQEEEDESNADDLASDEEENEEDEEGTDSTEETYEVSDNEESAEEESENLSQPEDESEENYEEDREESEEQQDDEDGDSEPQSQEADADGDDDNDDDDDDDDRDNKDESKENDEEEGEGSEELIREQRDVSEEILTTGEEDADQEAPPQTSGTGSVVVKVGVGVSIVVVAYVVLVRKWKSDSSNSANITTTTTIDDDTPQPIPDLSRRNTLVPPPSLEEVEPDMENVEEEYSEEEESQDSEENSGKKPSPAKQKYRELQSTYSRSLTPEFNVETKLKQSDDYYDDDDEEYEEEEEDEDDEGEEMSDNDDDVELLKKLEAKYGKLRREANDEEEEEEEDEEDDDEEEGEVDEDDFFTSWKRVNAPRKEDDESGSEREEDKRHSGAQSIYDYANITSTTDYAIRDELDAAQREIYNNTAYALKLFDAILQNHPSSPRALYGRAQTLDALAETKRSNEILKEAISAYIQTINAPDVPDVLFQLAAQRCIKKMHFIGRYGQAISVHQMLINRFPDIAKFRNQLAVTHLTVNNIEKARRVLQETLVKWPDDGVALVHYGFILKTVDKKLKEAAYYMRKGIKTRQEGVIDGRFYFHLGDALARLGRTHQAMEVYEEGVREKVFLSKYQRSLYNVARLTGKPWWRKDETPYQEFYATLESHWKEIRNEGLAVLNEKGYFKDESENLKDVGDWKQFELYARGVKNKENCKKCPITCQIITKMPDASGCKRGQSKFSVIHPGTHVWPHCGPTNCRLRVHLGLKVPPSTYIRVAEETRSWEEGKVIIFDDSFEHEVWHNGTEFRLVLIVDVWHPELTASEKKTLTPI